MPEYLSPAVFVEEVDTGSKPIEGVSTSTAGVVGVTERGPADVPLLVTNAGDYARYFGGLLDPLDFGDHQHLPVAVDGFFRNGGRRLYVSRVVSPTAGKASLVLSGRDDVAGGVLLKAASAGDGAAAPGLLLLNAGALATPAAGDPPVRIRIGDDSSAEWPAVATIVAPVDASIGLSLPLSEPFAKAPAVKAASYPLTAATGALAGVHVLDQPAPRGAKTVMVRAAAGKSLATLDLKKNALVLRWDDAQREAARVLGVADLGDGLFRLSLARPLGLSHRLGATLQVVVADPGSPSSSNGLTRDASAGDSLLFTAASPAALLEIGDGARSEIRFAATFGQITLAAATGRSYPRGALVEILKLAAPGSATMLSSPATAGARQVFVSDRSGLGVGQVLAFGAGPAAELATIVGLPGANGAAPTGPGAVALAHGLSESHEAGAAATLRPVTAQKTPAGELLSAVSADAATLLTTSVAGFGSNDLVRLTTSDGVSYLHRATAGTPVSVDTATLAAPLARNHPAGSTVVARAPLIEVEALDVGGWGDRLRISVENEASGLLSRGVAIGSAGANVVRMASMSGVEPGSVLEFRSRDGAPIGPSVKVDAVDRASGTITLHAALDPAQSGALGAPGAAVAVRSVEFRISAYLVRRPDPAVPTRNETVEVAESFRQLSMDPRHSRYFATVIGDADGPPRAWDRRPEGDSLLIRVRDLAPAPAPGGTDARQAIRSGPEALVDLMPSGATRAARHPLANGDDGLAALGDAAFIGQDDREPENRRGVPALKNVDDISLVACPGETSVGVQLALVSHCEEMRYRFAVLDGPPPANDSIADVQALRQNYDTKHAALYHPWLTVPDPAPATVGAARQIPVPPSGHVMGVYARTDVERGVHKAPANEVVFGVAGLRRTLNRAEHDLLNPFPSNINVIRDFRADNRAIRIWGARVLSSDPDFKYVSVRRLLLFIEKSIERGLGWVVFEPNAEPLWARVRYAISSFLETAWRNGALEGRTLEEAFFVICDDTTTTQVDRDNGKLIVKVGVAAVKPAEFVIVRIGLKTAAADD